MKAEKNNFKIPIVKVCYAIVDFFQKMTTTNLIRNTIVAENAEETTQRLATFANLSWLIFITLELVFKWTHPIVIILMVFRLWEIVVINI